MITCDIKLGDLIGVSNSYTAVIRYFVVTHIGRASSRSPLKYYSDSFRFSKNDITSVYRLDSVSNVWKPV